MNHNEPEQRNNSILSKQDKIILQIILLFINLFLAMVFASIVHTQPNEFQPPDNDRPKTSVPVGDTDKFLYLPIILWMVPTEEEPNDTPPQANLIEPDLVYSGRFPDATDINDYFYFELTTSALVQINLTSIEAGQDYTLVLRNNLGEFIAQSVNPGNSNELLNLPNLYLPKPLGSGVYYIQVYNAGATGTDHYYNLQLTITEILMIASFDECGPPNDLGGEMGAACPGSGCPPPNQLFESYPIEPPRDCILCAEYHILDWSAFWMKLNDLDMTPYRYLAFDIRGTGDIVGKQLKIEIKRDCHIEPSGTVCYELEIKYVGGITPDWQHKRISLTDFVYPGWPLPFKPVQDWSDLEELVYTVEANPSGRNGFFYLDNVWLEK